MKLQRICEPCIAAKQRRGAFPKATPHRSTRPLELICSDLKGPLPVRDRSQNRYWITFTCDYTRFRWVFPLKTKDEAFETYKTFEALAENQAGERIKKFRDDKGGEYIGLKWDAHFKERGILHDRTIIATPEQNGIAEKTNNTLAEGITAMLHQAKLPSSFWGEALSLFVRIMNASPTSALPDMTPYEMLYHRKPDLSQLRTFGSLTYVHIHKDNRKALQPHTRKCIYMGFEEGYKGFKFYDIEKKMMIISRDTVFEEDTFPGLSTKNIADFAPIEPAFNPFVIKNSEQSDESPTVPNLSNPPVITPPTQVAHPPLPPLSLPPPPPSVEVKAEPISPVLSKSPKKPSSVKIEGQPRRRRLYAQFRQR